MKKLYFIFVFLILFVGCSTKKADFSNKDTLVCKKSSEDKGTITNEKMIFSYDEDEVIHEFEIDVEYVYDHEISKNTMNIALSGFEIFASQLGIYFDSQASDNSLKFIFSGDIQKFEEIFSEVTKSNDLKNFKDKKSDALNTMTKSGYECE